LNTLRLVVRDGYSCQVNREVFLESVVKLDILLQLLANSLLSHCLFLLAAFAFKHSSKCEFSGVKLVNCFRQRCDFLLSIAFHVIALVLRVDGLLEGV